MAKRVIRNFRLSVVGAIVLLAGCSGDDMNYPYKTTENGLMYHFFETNPAGHSGNLNDIYTFNATFYTPDDSVYLQKQVRFLRTPVTYRGDFQEALAMLKVGDSAVFQFAADTFYSKIGQKKPDFFEPGEMLTLKVGVVSILDPTSFRIQMFENEIKDINAFVERKGWKVKLDSTGIRYEITNRNPEGVTVDSGDTVVIEALHWYTIEEKVITQGRDNDQWTIVVGDSMLRTPGLSRTLTFMREGESVRTILPFDQAFGEEGTAMVPPFTTIVIEMKVAEVRKKETQE